MPYALFSIFCMVAVMKILSLLHEICICALSKSRIIHKEAISDLQVVSATVCLPIEISRRIGLAFVCLNWVEI